MVCLFPGIPTVQFLIACSIQKWRGKAWSILSRGWHQCLPRYRQRGGCWLKECERSSLRLYLVVSVRTTGVSNIHETKNMLLLVQKEECMREMHSFYRGLLSPSVYLFIDRHNAAHTPRAAHMVLFRVLCAVRTCNQSRWWLRCMLLFVQLFASRALICCKHDVGVHL